MKVVATFSECQDSWLIDTKTHSQLHEGFNMKVVATFSECQDSWLIDMKVVVMVQHPSRVGGTDDHPSWNKSSYTHSYNKDHITSYNRFEKYVLKGDIINRMFKYFFNISEACLLTFLYFCIAHSSLVFTLMYFWIVYSMW